MDSREPNSRNSSTGDLWLWIKVYGSDPAKPKYAGELIQ